MGETIDSSYNRIRVHYPRRMVFIHGGGVSGWMWEQQISYFQPIRGSATAG
ncbi:hypothetical protein MOB78_02765 [Bacillus spizizenii]|nr:hypothetical protein [Bacillus spizizenii]